VDPDALIAEARAAGAAALDEHAGKRLLVHYGVAVPRSVAVADAGEAPAACAHLSPPLVVKAIASGIAHKSDLGAVRLDVADAAGVSAAIAAMEADARIAAARTGYLVEEQAAPGLEVVVGGLRDPRFGPLIMVGLGGLWVEVLNDVTYRICPITEGEAAAMLASLRGAPILDGVRGAPGVSRAAIVQVLLRLGGAGGLLLRHAEALGEMDVNPLIVSASGAVAVDARFVLADPPAVSAGEPCDAESLGALFAPRSVAVLGASASSVTIANTFIRRMKDFGYAGALYPIHPKAAEIEGLAACPRLAALPETVDYAYVAIAAERIPGVLAAAAGRVRFAQVISSGFGEVPAGQALERELLAAARRGGCRVIGPNCLGLYSPRGGVSFSVGAPREMGCIGVVSQSGGLSTDIIKRGQWRGLRFSGLVSIGNSVDVGAADLLAFYLGDAATRAVGMYLEDLRDGRRFFELLRSGPAAKPVVLLRGGRSRLGRAAAASHTGALAGQGRGWEALAAQGRCVMVDTLDDFLDALLALQQLELRPGRPTREVALFGNGGGTSVIATDLFAEAGLAVSPFPRPALAALEALGLPPGTSFVNPVDTPVRTLQEETGRVAGRILEIIYRHARPDAIVMHLNLAAFVGRGEVDPVENLMQAALDVQARHPGQAHFLLALRSDGSPELDALKRAYRERALAAGIPVYDELANAAAALAAVSRLEERFRETA
jgi:acyl-CoA synthetase (NDP forming)